MTRASVKAQFVAAVGEHKAGAEWAQWVLSTRQALGLTQERFGALVGRTLRTVQYWEAGSLPDPGTRAGVLAIVREHQRKIEKP
jgi:DNA-binding transcriptional regulator YiaG